MTIQDYETIFKNFIDKKAEQLIYDILGTPPKSDEDRKRLERLGEVYRTLVELPEDFHNYIKSITRQE